jgi:hypothetical protein
MIFARYNPTLGMLTHPFDTLSKPVDPKELLD